MSIVRLTHLDGKLPNLALMRLAAHHRSKGDDVRLVRTPSPNMFEPRSYDRVYGSSIFSWSFPVIKRLKDAFPDAIVGGTGSGSWETVEDVVGESENEQHDYSIYPDYQFSLGFTQRGCRLKCGFCVVPRKEGKVRSIRTIKDIWRSGTERKVVLLDNDFFGQEEWRTRCEEILQGNFKISFNQGINIRMITPEVAEALSDIQYFDDDFTRRRLYTAWDNLKDEQRFFNGLRMLNDAGIPSHHLMVYMLVGYRKGETMDDVLYRFNKLADAGCKPFPMVYEKWRQPQLRRFARWAIRRYYKVVAWEDYEATRRTRLKAVESLRLFDEQTTNSSAA